MNFREPWGRFLIKLTGAFARISARATGQRSQAALDAHYNTASSALFAEQQLEVNREQAADSFQAFENRPHFSIVVNLTGRKWIDTLLESLVHQYYPHWDLHVFTEKGLHTGFLRKVEIKWKNEKRMKLHVVPEGKDIEEFSRDFIKENAGEYLLFLDLSDHLTPDALYWVLCKIIQHPEATCFYGDEAKSHHLTGVGPVGFHIKPKWSPENLLDENYTGSFCVYQKKVLFAKSGFTFQGGDPRAYERMLRLAEITDRVFLISRILLLRRARYFELFRKGSRISRTANRRVLECVVKRREIHAKVDFSSGRQRIRPAIQKRELVSVIIPTDSKKNIIPCLDLLLEKSTYSDFEVLVVCHASLAVYLGETYVHSPQVRPVVYDKKFNFSDKCNTGAKQANGRILIFYNDDVFPVLPSWIEELVCYLSLPSIGGVSPKLIQEDGSIQYAGMFTGVPGLCGTIFNGYDHRYAGPGASYHTRIKNVSVLSGACLALRKEIFEEIGRFDIENTPSGHSDVDLSFRLLKAGYRLLYIPSAVLTHAGNHTWHEAENQKDKSDIYLLKRWGEFVSDDLYIPSSFKKIFYRDFPYAFRIAGCRPERQKRDGIDVLIYSHEMTLSGAPSMVLHLAKSIKRLGGFPVVITPFSGPLLHEFRKENITVVMDESVDSGHWMSKKFVANFDVVFANTLVACEYIANTHMETTPLIWWLHEGEVVFNLMKKLKKDTLKAAFKKANRYYAMFPSHCRDHVKAVHPEVKGRILGYGFQDTCPPLKISHPSHLTFLLAGLIEERKGQDVFCKAICHLDEELRQKAQFKILGGVGNGFDAEGVARMEAMMQLLHETTQQFDNVTQYGPMPPDELTKHFDEADVVVVPSRDDMCPLTAVQGFMQSKIVIVSDRVGTSQLITHGVNGFIFENENTVQLSDIMKRLLQGNENLNEIQQQSREIYQTHFSEQSFDNAVQKLLYDRMNRVGT